jgi:sugar lactone lactonase YvrE
MLMSPTRALTLFGHAGLIRHHTPRPAVVLLLCALVAGRLPAQEARTGLFAHGASIDLTAAAVNERGITCLAVDPRGHVWAGTTGRGAHLLRIDPQSGAVRSLVRLAGGIGFSYGLVLLPDGTLLAGTQADPTGLAVESDPQQVGRLYRFVASGDGTLRVEDLGVPVPGQGIYTLAYVPVGENSGHIVGLTWPDGHFFTYRPGEKTHDHGPIAGYRTYEIPRYAEKLNQGTQRNVRYARQVSRAIAVDPRTGAYTAGADGIVYRYDPRTQRIAPLDARLPCVAGREPWASLDAVCPVPLELTGPQRTSFVGGTSDGFLFRMDVDGDGRCQVQSWGKPSAQPGIQVLTARAAQHPDGGRVLLVDGVAGHRGGMPRWFQVQSGAGVFDLHTGGIPGVDGRASMEGFAALATDAQGNYFAGEPDRIARLVRFGQGEAPPATTRRPAAAAAASSDVDFEALFNSAPRLPCGVVFAPEGTTTEASGYTAIEVGRDGHVYVGSARYGGYAWLLRFAGLERLGSAARLEDLPQFMERVAHLRALSGEHREGINTQGKIHAKILVAADGTIYFATKQAHEVFATRPEYGEDPAGFPGGYLCALDPRTGTARALGILQPQEGLMAGALDGARGRLYYRSEPKNHFLEYDLATGRTLDRGHLGAQCRYMAIDSHGAVYTTGRGDTLCRYDPQSRWVEDLAVDVQDEHGYDEPYVLLMGPDGHVYGLGTQHPYVLQFDVAAAARAGDGRVPVRNVAPAAPPGLPVLDIHAAVFGRDGQLYYPLVTSDPAQQRNRAARVLLLMRYDPRTRQSQLLGVPEVQHLDEDRVRHTYIRENVYRLDHMQGAAVGSDGTLYLMDIYPQLNVACFPRLTAPQSP